MRIVFRRAAAHDSLTGVEAVMKILQDLSAFYSDRCYPVDAAPETFELYFVGRDPEYFQARIAVREFEVIFDLPDTAPGRALKLNLNNRYPVINAAKWGTDGVIIVPAPVSESSL